MSDNNLKIVKDPIRIQDKSTKYKVGIVSLGCDKNRVGSEIILGNMNRDYSITNNPREADIIIVTVTSNKENLNELIDIIKKYSKEKIVIIGQLTQDNIKISKKYEIELINIDLKQNQNEMIYANLINTIKEVYNL